jgi:hypothetical protein
VIQLALPLVTRRLKDLGLNPMLRPARKGTGPWITDEGNVILDCHCGVIDEPDELAAESATLLVLWSMGCFWTWLRWRWLRVRTACGNCGLNYRAGMLRAGQASLRPASSAGLSSGGTVCVRAETEPGGDSPTAHSLCPKVRLQIPPLRYPGFPVEVGGVGELHAAFFTESRTRGHVQRSVAGNPGTLRSG